MGVYEDYRAEMMRRFPFRVSRALPCPRVVAGLRCRYMRSEDIDCVCERSRFRILDHCHIWLTTAPWNGRVEHVLTSEPYDFQFEDLYAYSAALATAKLPVRVFLMQKPVWHPTTTLVVTMRDDSCLLPLRGTQDIAYIEGV